MHILLYYLPPPSTCKVRMMKCTHSGAGAGEKEARKRHLRLVAGWSSMT